ncbi:MAG: hypothetical protein MK130_03755, partial [Puniceicoccaceae bacterium]|nr:hypothetical protein [Puniceicoccaceae bacterium]
CEGASRDLDIETFDFYVMFLFHYLCLGFALCIQNDRSGIGPYLDARGPNRSGRSDENLWKKVYASIAACR